MHRGNSRSVTAPAVDILWTMGLSCWKAWKRMRKSFWCASSATESVQPELPVFTPTSIGRKIMAREKFWFATGAAAGMAAVAGVLAARRFAQSSGQRVLRLEKSINIGRPVDAVFGAWISLERLPEWIHSGSLSRLIQAPNTASTGRPMLMLFSSRSTRWPELCANRRAASTPATAAMPAAAPVANQNFSRAMIFLPMEVGVKTGNSGCTDSVAELAHQNDLRILFHAFQQESPIVHRISTAGAVTLLELPLCIGDSHFTRA